jgi:hypothetical protein
VELCEGFPDDPADIRFIGPEIDGEETIEKKDCLNMAAPGNCVCL